MAHWHFHYPKRIAFSPPDYEDPGVGGSEAALILLTRELVARGHSVHVFAACYRPGVYDGVRWRMLWEIELNEPCDVAVAVRFEEGIWPKTANVGRHAFWMLDDRASGPTAFVREHGPEAPVIIASEAMRRRLGPLGLSPRVALIPHPIEIPDSLDTARDDRICLFASMPNRGLDVALKIWPAIRARVSDAELIVTSGWRLWGYTIAEADDKWRQIVGRSALPDGCSILRSVPRSVLRGLHARAYLSLYPCRFPEMFCLSVAECAAAGVPCVTSDFEALKERVDHEVTGLLVPGDIDTQEVQAQFVSLVVSLLEDPRRRARYAQRGRLKALESEPGMVATRWESTLLS